MNAGKLTAFDILAANSGHMLALAEVSKTAAAVPHQVCCAQSALVASHSHVLVAYGCHHPACYPCLQVLMFSATLHSEEVKSMAEKLCQNPMLVDLKVSSLQCRQRPEPSAMHPSNPVMQEAGLCTWSAFHLVHSRNNAAPPWLVTLLTAVDHVV